MSSRYYRAMAAQKPSPTRRRWLDAFFPAQNGFFERRGFPTGRVPFTICWTIMRHPFLRTVIACAILLGQAVWAQKVSAPSSAAGDVDRIFAGYHHSDSPGCAVGATIDGATVLSAAYGMADLEHNVPLTPQSVFEAGSVSKQFTAGAVLLLVQQGKLSLDDPIRKYIPEVPAYEQPITIRNLINHTSGLRDWGSVEAIAGWPRTTRVYTHANVLEIVSRQRALNYPPGADYSYSNTGFNLAAMLVAKVSGKPFPQFTREAIFDPLDMSSTQWRDDFQRIVPNRSIAYSKDHGTLKMLMPFEDVYGNGGLLTTVGDLLRWNRNFTDAKVGGRSFVEAQHQQGRLNDGRTIAYAAGLMVLSWRGIREVSHSGSTAGYRAWLGRYPDLGLSVAVLCNVDSADATALGHQVADVYLDTALPKKPAPAFAHLDAAALESKAGLYRSLRDHGALAIEVKGGGLQVAHRPIVMMPVSSNVFVSREDGPRVEFESGPSGKVTRLRMYTELDEGDYYEKVEPAKPSDADMRMMTGDYSNDEAEVTLQVSLDHGALVIHRHPDTNIPLTPTYRDGFSSSLGSIRFIRDAQGRVVEMSIGEGRVWDLRLSRAQ
jgi:CubicO group peptidase (beta-lactamase class C family)